MAGEVRSELKITLQGGVGVGGFAAPSGGGFTPQRVARGSDTWGPGQAVGDYMTDRDSRRTRMIAEDLVRNQDAMRTLEAARQKSRLAFEVQEIASAVREGDRRRAFIDRVQQTRAVDQPGPRLIGARGSKPFFSRGFKSAVAGAVAGAGDAFGASPTVAGAVGNIAASVAGGFAFGGPAGAIIAGIQATIRNLEEITKSHNVAIQKLQAKARELKEKAESELAAIREQIGEDNKAFYKSIEEARVLREARVERKAYRRERYAPLTAGYQ